MLKNIKKNPKFLKILLIILFYFFGILLFSKSAEAGITYDTQVSDLAGSSITFGNNTRPLGEYIRKVYNYGVGITAILATVVLMIGGFQWIIAGGSGEKIGEAKAWITAALSGLVLALSSYMILNLVNPALVNFTVKEIEVIHPSGCCAKDGKNIGPISKESCDKKGGVWGGEASSWSSIQNKCLTEKESTAEYLRNPNCKGSAIPSTKGGQDLAISGDKCPRRCRPLAVDFAKSFWYGINNEIYCCTCVDTSDPLYCAGKPNYTLCKEGSGYCLYDECHTP